MQKGGVNRRNLATSSSNRNAIRPASVASSRQEESNKDEPGTFWDEVLEEGREDDNINQSDKQTMVQVLRAKQKRLEIEQGKQRQLLLEVDCNEESVPKSALPNASLIYAALTEKLGLIDDSSKHQVHKQFTN